MFTNTNFQYVGDTKTVFSHDITSADAWNKFVSSQKRIVRIQTMKDGSKIERIFKGKY